MKTLHYILLFTLTLFCADIYSQEGTLDLSFGNEGKVLFKFGSPDYYAYDAAIQSDGKILIVGCITFSGNNSDVLAMRLNSDGSIDNSFHTIGLASFEITDSKIECAKKVKVVGNKIIIAGYSGSKAFIMRLNMDGSPDMTFGADNAGFITTSTLGNINDFITIPLVNTYDIVGAGAYYDGFDSKPGLARFTMNGDVVSSFGTDGRAIISSDLIKGYFTGLTVVGTNTLYVFGVKHLEATPNNDDAMFAKFNFQGAMQNLYYIDGPIAGKNNTVTSFYHHLSSGDFIIGGDYTSNNGAGIYTCKIDSYGNILTSYGDGDSSYRHTTNSDHLSSVSVQSNGKILFGASSKLEGTPDFNVIRVNSNGSVDLTFNNKGWLLTDFNGGNDYIESMKLQQDKKLICVGNSKKGGDNSISVARYIVSSTSGVTQYGKEKFDLDIYPNPVYDDRFILSYYLPQSDIVTISLQSITGQSHVLLHNGIESSGYHNDQFVLKEKLNSGMYILKIETKTQIAYKKILML